MAQNTGDAFKLNSAFPKGNKQFSGDFVLIWMKQRLIWFNLQRDRTRVQEKLLAKDEYM